MESGVLLSVKRVKERERKENRDGKKRVTQQENNCSLIQLSWSIARGDNIHRSWWCCCFDKNLRSLWQFGFIAHCTMYFYFVALLELLSARALAYATHTQLICPIVHEPKTEDKI